MNSRIGHNYTTLGLMPFGKDDLALAIETMSKRPYHPIFSANPEARFTSSPGMPVKSFRVCEGKRLLALVSIRIQMANEFPLDVASFKGIFNPEVFFLGFHSPIMSSWSIMRVLCKMIPSDKQDVAFEMDVDSRDKDALEVATILRASLQATGEVVDKGIHYVDHKSVIRTPFWWRSS